MYADRVYIHHTQMVASDSDPRIQSALVAKWPEPIDVRNGIFIPGRVEKWSRELTIAMTIAMALTIAMPSACNVDTQQSRARTEVCDNDSIHDIDRVSTSTETMVRAQTSRARSGNVALQTVVFRCNVNAGTDTVPFSVERDARAHSGCNTGNGRQRQSGDADDERVYFHVSDVVRSGYEPNSGYMRVGLDDHWDDINERKDGYAPVWFRYVWNDERDEWNAIDVRWDNSWGPYD